MSNILEYRHEIDDAELDQYNVATLDGASTIQPIMKLPDRGTIKMQVCSIQISDQIPNIFNAAGYYNFDNTFMYIYSSLNPGTKIRIDLPTGLYMNVTAIQDAINSAIAVTLPIVGSPEPYNHPLWKTSNDPGFSLVANSVTGKIIASIDTSKLNGSYTLDPLFSQTVTFDFRKVATPDPGTDLGWTMGFSDTNARLTSSIGVAQINTIVSDDQVHMDVQGTICDIQCSLAPQRRRNDLLVRSLSLVSFAGKNTLSDNVWPSAGQISPEMVYDGDRTIRYIDLSVKTMAGHPMLFMGGAITVQIAFMY